MLKQCKCHGELKNWIEKRISDEKYDSIYDDLFYCKDCNKNYILIGGEYKYLTNSKFRQLVGKRFIDF